MSPRHSCALVASGLLIQSALLAPAGAATIGLDFSGGDPSFAVDATRHFLYAGERSAQSTKHFDVINTLTNSVVGSYSFTSSFGSTSDIAASGTKAFWADQGDQQVKVLEINAAGTPSLARNDGFTLPTGIGALPTTYGVSSQGGNDALRIVRISDGAVLHTTSLNNGVASTVHTDSLSGLYYVQNPSNALVIDEASGAVLRTVNGLVSSIDNAPSRHFVYVGEQTQAIQQLNGSDDSPTGRSADFGSGATITGSGVDPDTGNLWVILNSLNRVEVMSPTMTLLQQFTIPSPDSIAVADGNAYVHESGTPTVAVLTVPEPASAGCIALAGVGLLTRRRRRQP